MENENNKIEKIKEKKPEVYSSLLIITIFVVALVLLTSILPQSKKDGNFELGGSHPARGVSNNEVINEVGIVLPVVTGNLGIEMVDKGVINSEKFLALYSGNPKLKQEAQKLLTENQTGALTITPQNSPLLLNYFWALGLGNKNEILEKGEMMDPRYGGAGNFASTGGWSIANGKAMDHYSMHKFFTLTQDQQALVDKVSRNIYRPCCRNSTHFPDCNHGMAMLGFLELSASQGAIESKLYQSALDLNSYWFPKINAGDCNV